MEFIGRERELESMKRVLGLKRGTVREGAAQGAHGRNVELVSIEELYA